MNRSIVELFAAGEELLSALASEERLAKQRVASPIDVTIFEAWTSERKHLDRLGQDYAARLDGWRSH